MLGSQRAQQALVLLAAVAPCAIALRARPRARFAAMVAAVGAAMLLAIGSCRRFPGG